MPAATEFDGVILSGSEMGTYDAPPWMAPLRAHLDALRRATTPIFGICFGHQLMADVFGGKAAKAKTGYVAGAQAFEMAGALVDAHVAHQDQVVATPPGAAVIASAPYCPVGALDYDFPALSVQFHPEHSEPFARDLITLFGAELMDGAAMASAKASLRGGVAPDLYAEKTAAFFRAHHQRP